MAFNTKLLEICFLSLQFVEKDPKLAEPVLKCLLKYWPVTNSQKEVLFIGELEEILEMTQVHSCLLPDLLACFLAVQLQSHNATSCSCF